MAPYAVSNDVNTSRLLLRVNDIERATRFCQEILKFRVIVYGPDLGLQAAFLTGAPHQHFLLTLWNRPDRAHSATAPGLPYVAICYPSGWSFATAVRLAQRGGCEIMASWIREGASAVRLKDPDGHIIQFVFDRRRDRELRHRVEETPDTRGPVATAVSRHSRRDDFCNVRQFRGLWRDDGGSGPVNGGRAFAFFEHSADPARAHRGFGRSRAAK
jgi:catechol-2,3-dioxygenase